MNSGTGGSWWLHKRVLLPLVLMVGMLVAAIISREAADASTIVIYNETGGLLPPLRVETCGQSASFPTLMDRESVCIRLEPEQEGTAVRLELAVDPPWIWQGDVIKPHGGYRMTIRLWPDRQVESFTDISWWYKPFN
jgi:hypothetical protein